MRKRQLRAEKVVETTGSLEAFQYLAVSNTPSITKTEPVTKKISIGSSKTKRANKMETTGKKKRETPAVVAEMSSKALYQRK